jgi:hypothetical protein
VTFFHLMQPGVSVLFTASDGDRIAPNGHRVPALERGSVVTTHQGLVTIKSYRPGFPHVRRSMSQVALECGDRSLRIVRDL